LGVLNRGTFPNVSVARYTPSTLTRLADGFGLKVPYGIVSADSPQIWFPRFFLRIQR